MNEKNVDVRNGVRVVTSNDFITACGLENITLKARKLLYIAISQCRMTDAEFYEYKITAKQFAEIMDIDPSNVYQEADKITDELMRGFLRIDTGRKGKKRGTKSYKKYSLFAVCEYTEDSMIYFKVNKDMTEFLLELKSNFTQPLLEDFLRMNSPYSMEIWHLMQREMKSKRPYGNHTIEFDLFLDELRKVTGTQDKLKQIIEFKRRVLNKAIREIKDNCNVIISYENIKEGRKIIGFHFKASSPQYMDEIDPILKQQIEDRAEQARMKAMRAK